MWQQRRLIVAFLAVFLSGSALSAWAGHATSTVPSYTGCLNTTTGVLSKLKRGTAPLSACASGEVTLHVSGGDITAVLPAAGGGLTGGGQAGQVELGLDYPAVDARYVNEGQANSVTSAMLTNGNVTNIDLASAIRKQLRCAVFPKGYADLSGCDLSYANLQSAQLLYTNLTGADLRFVILDDAFVYQATLDSANMTGTFLRSADLRFASVQHATMASANLTSADLGSANLTGTDLTTATLTAVTWESTTCPDGTNSATNGTGPESCFGHLTP